MGVVLPEGETLPLTRRLCAPQNSWVLWPLTKNNGMIFLLNLQIHRVLSIISETTLMIVPGVVSLAHNPSTWEVEAEGPGLRLKNHKEGFGEVLQWLRAYLFADGQGPVSRNHIR